MVKLNEQRQKVFMDRYAKRNSSNVQVEKTPEEMWRRVASTIGDTTAESTAFYDILEDFKFVPAGRIMAGAGVGTEQTFYNCYVIPVEPKPSTLAAQPQVGRDSREAIFDTIATMVDIMSRGGGVGINWSTLRPSGSYLSRVSGTSSGPVGWMDVASKAVGEVEQGGSRRGAAMFMINDWHPDLLNFIEAKRDLNKITNANVSVAISDKFMKAVKEDAGWSFEFPNPSEPAYNTEWDGDLDEWKSRGYGVSLYRSMPARAIWNAITDAAWSNGEPGVVFLDRYNQLSTGRGIEKIISVNPCGEQGLGAYSVCNLGSMNVAAYVAEGPEGTMRSVSQFDWVLFSKDVATAFRFMDNVIDKSFYWDDRSKEIQKKLRRVGLGVMGLADAMILCGIRYGSVEAVQFTEDIYRTMKDVSIETSVLLAQEKGPAEAYDSSVWRRPYLLEYVHRHIPVGGPITDDPRKPLRNLFFLTQAPTGTTSILAGVSSGLEPLFALEYTRTDRTGTHSVRPEVLDKIGWDGFKNRVVVTASDVTVEEHIAIQAAAQRYIDSSVSKTINAPNSHTKADVDKAYRLAYDSGLKGVAYFRDGCGRDQVLSTDGTKVDDKSSDRIAELEALLEESDARVAQLEEEVYAGPKASVFKRPAVTYGQTSRLNTSMGTMYLTVNHDEAGKPVEIFVNVGKAGSDVMSMGEAIGRLVSLGLQTGISLPDIAKQLVGVGGTSSFNPGLVHAIGKALDAHNPRIKPLNEVQMSFEGPGVKGSGTFVGEVVYEADPPLPNEATKDSGPGTFTFGGTGSACPDCGDFSVYREEGCSKCHSCGWSGC